jgi:dipeptidyl-peptidase-4
MNTILPSLILFLQLAAVASAADPMPEKPLDTSFLKEYAETRGYMLGRPQKPKISPDGKTVLFLRAEPKTPKMKLFEFDVASGKTRELLSPEMLLKGAEENLTPEEKARRERQRVSVGGFTDFHLDKDGKNILVMLAGKLYVFERATGKITQLNTGEGGAIVDPKWSPDGKKIAYVRGFDVFVYDLATGKESSVTTGGTAIKTHGLAEFVAQEEMGRFSGFWWSPDSKFIAYTEADHTGVETWWIADPLKPDQKPIEQFYPRPGKQNVSVRLGIIPVTGGETVWAKLSPAFEYLARVDWGKGGLVCQLQSRDQQLWGIDVIDPSTGSPVPRMSSRMRVPGNQGWMNLFPGLPLSTEWQGHPLLLIGYDETARGPAEEQSLGFGDSLLWMSGFKKDGGRIGSRAVRFNQFLSFDPQTTMVFVIGSADPTQAHVGRVVPGLSDTLEIEYKPITTEPGVHTAVLSKDHSRAVVTSTSLTAMPVSKVQLAVPGGKTLGTLPSVAIETPFQPNVKVEKVGDYWTAIVRPRNFDPKKKYPVIVDVYGGPKHQHVVQAMRNWLVPQWLADQGFIVVAIDNRGTPGRGRDWEQAVYQKFGSLPLEDQVKGLKLLCEKHPEMDCERVGIVGWSFGGYMAANGVLRRPDVFKAAVAGAPVTDWEDYDTHYTERYMGLLPESKAAYDEASLIPLAKNLKRPLLLVHGTADDNVYYRHTLKLADALFRAGKEFESLALPGVTHMYSADPVVMERLWAKTASFFRTHLGAPKE